MSSSQQQPTNLFPNASGNSSSNSRMNEEIKRLQQLQRLRAACSFPSTTGGAGGGQGLLSTPGNGFGTSSNNDTLNLMNNGMGGNPMMNMNMNPSGSNAGASSSGASSGNANSNNSNMLALMAAQQQQQQQQEETRLMLLQQQLRMNNSSGNNNAMGNNSGMVGNPTSSPVTNMQFVRAAAAAGLSSLPTPASLLQQQQQQQAQLQLQAQFLQQQQQRNAPVMRPLMRVGAIEPFPEKLHRMLMEVEQCGRGDIISFINNGRGFAIHKPDTFFKEIVPLYFRHSRLSSFKRQLNLYGFEQINIGPYRGGYYHEQFHRDNPEACRRMRRVAVKVSGAAAQRKKEQQEAAAAKKKEEDEKDSQKDEEGNDDDAKATKDGGTNKKQDTD